MRTEKKNLTVKVTETRSRPYHLFFAHGLAVGARASDVEEGFLLGGREGWG